MTLKELQIGKSAVIKSVGSHGALRQHFLDMGMIPGVEITVVKLAPMGDPMEVQIHGYELTLRLEEADQIEIDPLVFSLLYSPCVAAIASVKRELGTRWAVGLALWQCMIAWIAALIVRFIGLVI